MKLELKHLAPYLPYGLRIYDETSKSSYELDCNNLLNVIKYSLEYQDTKPILRPLTDLTKEEFINDILGSARAMNGCKITPFLQRGGSIDFYTHRKDDTPTGALLISQYWKLFELHFDVFGLIDKGLAIDINTI